MPTYDSIASVTLSSTSNDVTFTSISSSYTDLVLVMSNLTSTTTTGKPRIRFNNDTSANYNYVLTQGLGSTVSTQGAKDTTSTWISGDPSMNSTTPSSCIVHINSYSSTAAWKTAIAYGGWFGESGNRSVVFCLTWKSTSAISTVNINSPTYAFNSGSTFSLYGITAG